MLVRTSAAGLLHQSFRQWPAAGEARVATILKQRGRVPNPQPRSSQPGLHTLRKVGPRRRAGRRQTLVAQQNGPRPKQTRRHCSRGLQVRLGKGQQDDPKTTPSGRVPCCSCSCQLRPAATARMPKRATENALVRFPNLGCPLAGCATKRGSSGICPLCRQGSSKPVSYTHLTLPTKA